MGKRKRGMPMPTKNKFWSNIVNAYSPGGSNNLRNISYAQNPSTSAPFQVPHQQDHEVQDLTDDTSPNIPMTHAGPGVRSQGPGDQSQNKQQDAKSKSPIVIGLNPTTQNKSPINKSSPTTPQKAVVEGVASNIKLFGTKSISVEKDKPASPSTSGNKVVIVQDTKTISPAYTLPQKTTVPQPTAKAAKGLGGKAINTRITRATPVVPPVSKPPIQPLMSLPVMAQPPMAQPPMAHLPVAQRPGLLPTPPSQLEMIKRANLMQYEQHSLDNILYNYSYPKGIPRSFLNTDADNPYSGMVQNMQEQNRMSTPAPQNWTNAAGVYDFSPDKNQNPENPTYGDVDGEPIIEQQAYSPSDVYDDNQAGNKDEEQREGSESPDLLEPGQKRLSAFRRLGPLTQPKKPKMTINLLCNKDQSVREVVDETEQKYVPVHLREDIKNSEDETVKKYLKFWPWEKGLSVRKTVMARTSKSVMMLEQEQMDEVYEKAFKYIQVSVQGYPRDWTKEMLLDTLLDFVNGKSFVPLFIEFAPQECKFLVIKSRAALIAIHKAGFIIRKDDVELTLALSQTDLNVNKIDYFTPKLVLKSRMTMGYDGEKKLDLSSFTTKEDISHFIYFPLNRANHQAELIQLPSTVSWKYLTELNLSHNKLTSIDGLNLTLNTPKLRHLDLSYNLFSKVTVLLRIRDLVLHTIKLEGNPLCRDYTDPARYVRALKMMFPALTEIDDTPIHLHGDMPKFNRNFCPIDAKGIIDKFLEVYFPLLDATDKDRSTIEELYHEKACMTVTYRPKLRYAPIYRNFRTIFNHSRSIDEGELGSINGSSDIARLINKWPPLKHDPFTFTVDVLQHDDTITIFKVAGIMKLTSESLADDEYLLSFSRTFVLHTNDGFEYKITNEMVYWDQPTEEYANTGFRITTVRPKCLSLEMEAPPDEDLKEKLLEIFMQLSELDKSASERCLEHRDWNLKAALEYFMKLVKLDEIEILSKGI